MARKYITREQCITTLKTCEITVVNGTVQNIPMADVVLLGKFTDEQVTKQINKMFKGKQVVVLEKTETSKFYRVSVEKFMEVAEEYQPKKSTQNNEEITGGNE